MIVQVPYGKDYTRAQQICKCGQPFIYVSCQQNNMAVTLDTRIVETQLRRYAVLYFMLGLIEKELRKRVVITLSSLAREKGYSTWFSIIPPSEILKRSIKKASRKNGHQIEGVEEYLPFGFWRRIFIGSNYITLWIPGLHLIFPALVNPLEKRSFDRVGTHLHRASHIRNRVAHYEIRDPEDFEEEKSVLMWLLRAMDKPFALMREM